MVTLFKTKPQAEKEAELWRKRGYNIEILKTERPGFKYKIVSLGKREHIRLNMSQKEIAEGRRTGIPEVIMGKMIQGFELIEREKDIVKSKGKVYVLGHTKERGTIKIKPQLRDLPGGGRISRNNKKDEAYMLAMYLIEKGQFDPVANEVRDRLLYDGYSPEIAESVANQIEKEALLL